jgi:hypothetical protein
MVHWKAGRTQKAMECFQNCVDVTPDMAHQLIKELKKQNVEFIVAPYEADAQLAYLEKIGYIDAILTEDSDLLVFGCKRVLYKLGKGENTVEEVRRERFREVAVNNFVLGGKFTDDKFRWMCILSGCDYLKSIDGIGIKTAYKHLVASSSVPAALRSASLLGKFKIPSDYMEDFERADRTFLYQRVYCPNKKCLVTLNEVPEKLVPQLPEMDYIGKDLDPKVAHGIATGRLNPQNHQPFVSDTPTGAVWSSWSKEKKFVPIENIPIVQPSVKSHQTPREEPLVRPSFFKKTVKPEPTRPSIFKPIPVKPKEVVEAPEVSPYFACTQPMPVSPKLAVKRPIFVDLTLDAIDPELPPTQPMSNDETIFLISSAVASPTSSPVKVAAPSPKSSLVEVTSSKTLTIPSSPLLLSEMPTEPIDWIALASTIPSDTVIPATNVKTQFEVEKKPFLTVARRAFKPMNTAPVSRGLNVRMTILLF